MLSSQIRPKLHEVFEETYPFENLIFNKNTNKTQTSLIPLKQQNILDNIVGIDISY